MSTKIGHFEILGELSKSAIGAVYKAIDPQSGQIVALKAIQLNAFGESAGDLEKALAAEAESTNALSSAHLTPVFGAGEIDGQFCAAMEYVQGNSVATMVARKEGFTIWDLLDIGRQVCNGLDHAHSRHVYHYSLEPGKIMCGWDGTVKILGFGVSSAGKFVQQIPGGVPPMLHYMSPEQLSGAPVDGVSNLFSLGAMFYEMVTDRKAFDREDAESLRQSILESSPVPPMHVNPKIHPLLSDLIMKALEKDPAQRYQSGKELLEDLEQCKESKSQGAKTPPGSAKTTAVAQAAVSAQPSQITSQITSPVARAAENKSAVPSPVASAKPQSTRPPGAPVPIQNRMGTQSVGGGAAAAPARVASKSASSVEKPKVGSNQPATPRANVPSENPQASAYVPPSSRSGAMQDAVQNELGLETFTPDTQQNSQKHFEDAAPKFTVDPSMAEGGPVRAASTSFSEMTELPPLKEIYIAPPPPPSSPMQTEAPSHTVFHESIQEDEKPKIQPREVAEKAIKEIKNVPPRLLLYSIAGAAVLILIIAIGLVMHVHTLNGDDDSGAARPSAAVEAPAQPVASKPVPQAAPAPVETVAEAPQAPVKTSSPAAVAAAKAKIAKKKIVAAAPAPVVIMPGQMAVDSTPQGAQVQVDGRTDPSWVTPFSLASLQPGQHSITVSKSGYSTDTRSVEVASGNKAAVIVHLTQLMATLAVSSEPAGASIYVDGKDMGKTTPAQVSVDKGQHVVLVRKAGYIDETSTAQFVLGQTVSVSPALRPLGNADSIKTVGKMKKLFGGNSVTAGQATVSVRTQPKGAQVSVNQHMLDKGSPVDVALDPGNYVIDITLSGYAPVHKVVTADKGGKVVVDEVLQRQ